VKGGLLADRLHLDNDIYFQDGGSIPDLAPRRQTEVLDRPFRHAGGLTIPPGYYEWWYLPLGYTSNPARTLSGTIEYRPQWGYFGKGGKRDGWTAGLTLNLSGRAASTLASVEYTRDLIRLADGQSADIHVINSRFDVAFSRRWMTRTVFQYSNTRELIGTNFRLRYNYRAGDDLYVVVSAFRQGSGLERELDRFVAVKFTHSLDF
jgi:hypothetical protein